MAVPPKNPPERLCSFPRTWFNCQAPLQHAMCVFLLENKILGIIYIELEVFDLTWAALGGIPHDYVYDHFVGNRGLALEEYNPTPETVAYRYRLMNTYWNNMLVQHNAYNLYTSPCAWENYTPTLL